MRSLVQFRTAQGAFAIPVEVAREVRMATRLTPLPTPRPGVAGVLLERDVALTVIDVLGSGCNQILVLEVGGQPFGLLVEEVLGVSRVPDDAIGPPPAGQAGDIVAGVVSLPSGAVLLVDPDALGRSLR
jgi:chemotaxis signal transduction protein